MSPLERWKSLASPDRLFLPLEPDELEIVCCDTVERTITHAGIRWAHADFQSPALQKLARNLPANLGGKVIIHHSGHLARIWVRDPADGSFLEVLNADPDTKDLTVKQAKDLELVRGKQDSNSRISAAEGRRRIRDLTRQIIDCKNQSSKRTLLKLLNLLPIEQDAADRPVPPLHKHSKARRPKGGSSAASPEPISPKASMPRQEDEEEEDAPLFSTTPFNYPTLHEGASP